MRRTAIAVSAVVACAAVLAACGSSGSGSGAITTATVPAGTLGDSASLTAAPGAYSGMTGDGRAVAFTVKGNEALNFRIGNDLFAARMPMKISPPGLHYGYREDVVTAAWETPTRVAGAFKEHQADGHNGRTTWTATTG
jgi:hypothetical protein